MNGILFHFNRQMTPRLNVNDHDDHLAVEYDTDGARNDDDGNSSTGTDEDHEDEDEEQHLIFDAISHDNVELVDQCMLHEPLVLYRRHLEFDQTPVHFAVWEKKSALALRMIESGLRQDFDSAMECEDWKGSGTLHIACELGYLDVVKALVYRGADPIKGGHAPHAGPFNPLMCAVNARERDVVEFLLRYAPVRSHINDLAPGGRTVLGMACEFVDNGIIQLLLDAGADPTFPEGENSPANVILYDECTVEHRANILPNLALIQAAIARRNQSVAQ